ncbi:IRK-interacting protein-like [Aristolochia californica]|uniref:IRK-interacting protein-like n=1 Tax=Aristolochia californica TaxID=171875 RepID=UPI0035D554B6
MKNRSAEGIAEDEREIFHVCHISGFGNLSGNNESVNRFEQIMMASSSSKASSPLPPLPSPRSPYCGMREEGGIEAGRMSSSVERSAVPSKHHPTPLHASSRRASDAYDDVYDDRVVSCNKCRPNTREKISVVPVDGSGGQKRVSSISSPISSGLFKSIFSSLTRKSPKSGVTSSTAPTAASAREEQWKLAVTELSHKLLQATRKRDEAVLEASKLKYSMAELEKKLNKLEIYCDDLKSGLELCNSSPYRLPYNPAKTKGLENKEQVIEPFLLSVAEARTAVRHLSRFLTLQLRQTGGKVFERITALLQPYEIKISISRNPRSLLFYLEALLNRAFYEDFESIGFQRNGSASILNPIEQCEANFSSFTALKGLTWDEVLNKGTRHFSETFSRFCDRKMSEIVAMLGWSRAWPEALLQAFFVAAKSVWLVHLLACAVHPSLPIFRVDKSAEFDGVYMEDMIVGEKVKKLMPTTVRVMVAPGFFVFNSVVKCKVLCRYDQQTT